MKKKTPKTDISKIDLNLLQEEFCKKYTSRDYEYFGNGTQCYLAVYGPLYFLENKKKLDYKVAQVLAHKALSRVNIYTRINELLEEGGFNEQNVDKQHLFVINQCADIPSKIKAISEFNKLKKRIDNKIELVLPTPILGKVFSEDKTDALRRHNSNEKDPGSGEEN